MGFTSKLRWILMVFILLFILIFVGWGLSAIARKIFSKSASDKETVVIEDAEAPSLDGTSVVRYIVDGPIIASSEHRRYSIEVSRTVATMRVYSDYGLKIVAEKSYTNNTSAFDNLVQSLEKSDATARYEGTDVEEDYNEQGVCPTGRRYILEIGDDIRRWTTSCDRKQGTAAGKMTTMRTLFTKQIPDFDALVKGTSLSRR